MSSDKKKKGGKVRFILMREVGDVFISRDVAETAVVETIENLQEK
jgi:3-dehydroquinate synthetase